MQDLLWHLTSAYMKCVYGWAGGRACVRYVITKFSRMDSLPNFLTHGAPLRARELLYYLPHNKTDGFLYVWKSRPGPSFVPALILAFVPCIVFKAVEFFLSLNWFLCLFARWWITGCTFKDACSDAETAKHDFLGFTPLTHAPECSNIKFPYCFVHKKNRHLLSVDV